MIDTGWTRSWTRAPNRTVVARAVAFEEGGVTFEILWPVPSLGQEFPDGDLNDASVVLLMTFGDVSFLLTGDIEEGGANALLNAGISADVLKVPHQLSGPKIDEFWS